MKRLLPALLLLSSPLLAADDKCHELATGLQQRWDEITYSLPEAEREEAYEALTQRTAAATAEQPHCAEAWIWDGITQSTYAGAAGGLGALKSLRLARTSLERALKLDDKVLAGGAHTTLGSLYYQAPGWPISFRDQHIAEQHLRQALAIAPDDIDANYFYGDYLVSSKRYADAKAALEKALAAPPRPGRTAADAGRRQQIQALLDQIAAKQ